LEKALDYRNGFVGYLGDIIDVIKLFANGTK